MDTDTLLALAGKSKVTQKWLSHQLYLQRQHEVHLGVMRWLAQDEEAKYYLGIVLGSATAVASAIAQGTFQQKPTGTDALGVGVEFAKKGSPVFGAAVDVLDWAGLFDAPGGGGGPLGYLPNVTKMASMGFVGICSSVLIFKSIFSGTDLGELLSGVGEIIPL